MPTVTIDPRFCGPPRSGNGGYVCGVLAGYAVDPVVVSLRVPPPLDRPMEVVVDGPAAVRLLDGDTLVAETAPSTDPHPDLPASVDLELAEEAARGFVGFHDHPFPTCWTCGPARDSDGLQIFPGPVEGVDGLVAAPWTPTAEVDGGTGAVARAHVWAALDCPSYFGAAEGEPALLASMAADLWAPVRVGEPHVVLGWATEPADGRRRHGGSAILDADGTILALASTLWVTVSADALHALLEGA